MAATKTVAQGTDISRQDTAGKEPSDMTRTIAVTRNEHPDLYRIWDRRQADTAYAEVIRRWQAQPEVAAELPAGLKARDKHCERLIKASRRFLEDEGELVSLAWAWNAERIDWAAEKPWVREVFEIISCQAAETGPNVISSHLLLTDLIYARFGTKRSTESTFEAKVRLKELGVFGVTTRSRNQGTIWHVLTYKIRTTLASLNPCKQDLPPAEGLVCTAEAPRFSDRERAVFTDTVQRLRVFDWRKDGAVWDPLWVREARAKDPREGWDVLPGAEMDAILAWEPSLLAA